MKVLLSICVLFAITGYIQGACVNQKANCNDYYNRCSESGIRDRCPETCGACRPPGGKREESVLNLFLGRLAEENRDSLATRQEDWPPAPPVDCKDDSASCADWANLGRCSKDKVGSAVAYVTQEMCRKTCKVCTAKREESVLNLPLGLLAEENRDSLAIRQEDPAAPAVDCKDDEPGCAEWAEDGRCNQIKTMCRKSCNLCTAKREESVLNLPLGLLAEENRGACVDLMADCNDYSSRCTNSDVRSRCPVTCNACPEDSLATRQEDPAAPAVECKDNDAGCVEWAKQGRCSKVQTVCRKSCKVCTEGAKREESVLNLLLELLAEEKKTF